MKDHSIFSRILIKVKTQIYHECLYTLILSLIICYGSTIKLYDEIAVLVHQDIIYTSMNTRYTVPPKIYTSCVLTNETGYPNLIRQINLTFSRGWNQSEFVEMDENIKVLKFPQLIEKYKTESQNFTINVLSDVFVSMLQVIYSSKTYYYSDFYPQTIWLDEYTNSFRPRNVIGSYDTVVCIGHYNNRVFGHYILDFLAPFMIIPDEIKQKCVIPYGWRGTRIRYLYKNSPFAIKGLIFAGLKYHQLIIMQPNDLIFAREAYIFDKIPFNWDCSEAIRRLRKSILTSFSVQDKPYRLGLYNRKPTQCRYIKNFDVIVEIARKRWPNLEIVPDFPDLYDAIAYYQSMQSLFMGFHGSIFGNTLFMQAGSAVCEFLTNMPFTNSIDMTMPLGIHHVMARMPNYIHHTYTPTDLNVTISIMMIEKCNELSGYK